jgi:hypothetical protein
VISDRRLRGGDPDGELLGELEDPVLGMPLGSAEGSKSGVRMEINQKTDKILPRSDTRGQHQPLVDFDLGNLIEEIYQLIMHHSEHHVTNLRCID